MARAASINVSLTRQDLRLIHQQVNSGNYQSASEVVRESLRALFRQASSRKADSTDLARQLERGYKATSRRDRKMTNEWASLPEAWPEE
jgi:putative addiction module CopG family antidote